MSLINIAGLAPDDTGRFIRVNQFGELLAATADFFPNGSVLLGSAQATALQADSVPLATYDTANKRPGWFYNNTTAGNKINWYYYSDASGNNNRTYAQLAGLTCTMAIDGTHPPFFVVYTKPKAPLNPAHPWYDKVVIYQNQDADLNLFPGQKCLMYFAATAQDFPPNQAKLREINCPILVAASDVPDPTDEILFITLQSDSAFLPNTFSGVVSQVGFKFVENIVEYELRAEASTGTGSDVNITNAYLDTHSTLYLGGTPIEDGTNALPVIVNGTVVIDPYATVSVNVANTAVPISNTSLDSQSFTVDGTDSYLNVVAKNVPTYNAAGTEAVVSRIVDATNTAFNSTVAGALDVNVVNTAVAVSNSALTAMTFDKGTDLNVRVVSQPLPINVSSTNAEAAVCQIVDSLNAPFTNTVAGALDVCVVNTSAVSNASLTAMTFSTENNLQVQLADATGYIGSGNPLIVQNQPPALTTLALTLANFTPTTGAIGAVSGGITTDNITFATIFGNSTHSGSGGNPSLTYQYSNDNINFYDTAYSVNLPHATDFMDVRQITVPYIRFKISSHALTSIDLNVCLK